MKADAQRAALAEGFAQQIERWALAQGGDAAAARLAARAAQAASLATGDGHVCLPLDELAEPAAREALLRSGVVGTPAQPGARPLILDDDGRLYLHRHFDDERLLAQRLRRAAAGAPGRVDATDAQQRAVALALQRRLVVVSGGPGTGKTTTVVALLARLIEQDPDVRIALAAPTGKAAARLSEALRQRAAHLPPALRARLPAQAATVHRLLGAGPGGFAHDAQRPLAIDVLVVDEASMLDLALAARLLAAVPDTTRLVLLGDQDQLAAVEAGAVFAELCADGGPLRDSVVRLTHNYRFDAASGIARAAAAVRDGQADELLALLRRGGGAALHWLDDGGSAPAPATWQRLRDGYAPYLQALRAPQPDVGAVVRAFERFRVLCAQREGLRGVEAVNRRLEVEARALLAPGSSMPWFTGRPLMVLRNDPLLGLFNGDIGITLAGADGVPMVHFAAADGGFRALPALRLPPHETAFAMTVHKAQGSEFDEVLVLLPAQRSRVLTRELLYTALTRAKQCVRLAADAAVLQAAVAARTQRRSGLQARLREHSAAS